jgi:hypothetical protein
MPECGKRNAEFGIFRQRGVDNGPFWEIPAYSLNIPHSVFPVPHSLFQRIVKSAIADFDLDLKSGTFAQVLQNRAR